MFKFEKTGMTEMVINKRTGEVREQELVKCWSINIENSDKFYQMYSNGVLALCNIKPDYCAKIFMYMCMHANDNIIHITSDIREDIIEKCNLKSSSITSALKVMVEYGIIKRIVRGKYQINPMYSWDGKSSDRQALLKKAKCTIICKLEPNEEIFDIKKHKTLEELLNV